MDDEKTFYFSTKAAPIQTASDVQDLVESIRHKVEKQIEQFTSKGSNWVVASINNVKLCLVRYHVLRGGANKFVMPAELAVKKCVLNIRTEGEECFMYAAVAALHFEEVDDGNRHRDRRQQYDQFVARYYFENINFPATADDVKKFVKQNEGVAIKALMWVPSNKRESAHVVPIYHPHTR